jgi:hypothetical protein
MMTGDTMTIVRCRPPLLLAKRIMPGHVQACDRVKTVDLFVRAVDGLAELEERLRELLDRPDCAVVRGAPADPGRTRNVRRLVFGDPTTGAPASLKAQPRLWLATDFDGLPAPAGLDLTDLSACGKHIRSLLPAAFHQASCIIQATASHLVAAGLYVRTWHWLSRPVSEHELKNWLKGSPADASIFNPAQLVYTARPLFAGRPDPAPERLVVLFGAEDIVMVPDPAVLAPPLRRFRPPPQPGSVRADAHASLVLAQVATAVLRAPEGQRHKTIVIGARRLAELEQAGLLHPDESASLLSRAARGAGFDDARLLEVARILGWARRGCLLNTSAGEGHECGQGR